VRIAMFEGYGFGSTRRRRRGSQSKLARAAKACKGRKKDAFLVCVRKKMKSRR
jgi:hypothetical protein